MSRKVLLILVDGMRPDALSACPSARRALEAHAHTLTAQTVLPSVTLPCHMSLFHSVDPVRHNNLTNVYVPQVRPVNGLFDVLSAAGKRSGMFFSWEELRDLGRPGSLAKSVCVSGREYGHKAAGSAVTDEAIAFIGDDDPDFVFLYLGFPDEAGHDFGWMSETYLESVRASWTMIDRITENLPENWAVFITADHGGHERMHGSDCPEDMTIPLIAYGSGTERIDLSEASIKDLAPTIATLLNVVPDPQWEGRNLIR